VARSPTSRAAAHRPFVLDGHHSAMKALLRKWGLLASVNHNRCTVHLPGGQVAPNVLLADTGRCGERSCGAVCEVFDLELLSVYAALGLPDVDVHRHLPRLRHAYLASAATVPLTWTDVGHMVAPHVLRTNESQQVGAAE